MRLANSFSIIDTHSAGEPIRIIRDGMPVLRGSTMLEKMNYMKERFDWIRTCTMCEPRGHKAMVGAVFTEPVSIDADIGVFYIDLLNYAPMCGAGSIAVAKVLVEVGMVTVKEPVTTVVMDTPAGLVSAYVSVENGDIINVTVENVPSFLSDTDVELKVSGLGEIHVDIGYGGNYFVFVDVDNLKIDILTENIPFLVEAGMEILKTANEKIQVQHPVHKEITFLNDMMFCQKPRGLNTPYTGMVVFGNAQFDRSPCGTGTCARMARMYSKGELKLNQSFLHRSVIGTLFKGTLIKEEKVGEYTAVVPRISGEAYITGFNNLIVDSGDGLKNGFWF